MKTIRYALSISMLFCFVGLASAQTNRTDSTKFKKSSPVPVRPVTPPPGGTTTNLPPLKGTKSSAPVRRISKQPAPVNTAQPTTTPAATSTTTYQPADPNKAVGNGMLNIGLIAGIPQGQFATNTNNDWGWGLDITALWNLGQKKPKRDWASQPMNVYMGAALQFMYHGGKTDTYKYNDQFSETTIDSKVSNGMWGFGFLTRTEFLYGPVKPFVELTAGLRFFNGRHSIDYTNELYNSSDPNDTRKQTFTNKLSNSPVGYYGAAGGLRIGSESFRVELKVTYLKGSTAEYVDLENLKFDQTTNSVEYTTKRSTTDMIIPQLGLSLIF
jgi:hypothetical protein